MILVRIPPCKEIQAASAVQKDHTRLYPVALNIKNCHSLRKLPGQVLYQSVYVNITYHETSNTY